MTEPVILGLAEVVLRAKDVQKLTAFYEGVLGLQVVYRSDDAVFLLVGPGVAGHPEALGIFSTSIATDHPSAPLSGLESATSPMHHLAFEIAVESYESERERLMGLGLDVRGAEFAWSKARSLFMTDPEGNVVELVCHDGSMTLPGSD